MSDNRSFHEIMHDFQMELNQEKMELQPSSHKRKSTDVSSGVEEATDPENKSPPIKVNRPKPKRPSMSDQMTKSGRKPRKNKPDELLPAALQINLKESKEPTNEPGGGEEEQRTMEEEAIKEIEHNAMSNLLAEIDKGTEGDPPSIDPEILEPRRTYRVSTQMMDFLTQRSSVNPLMLEGEFKKWQDDKWANLVDPPEDLLRGHYAHCYPESWTNEQATISTRIASNNLAQAKIRKAIKRGTFNAEDLDRPDWILNPEVIPFYQQIDHILNTKTIVDSVKDMTETYKQSITLLERKIQSFTMTAKTAVTDHLQSVKAVFESNGVMLSTLAGESKHLGRPMGPQPPDLYQYQPPSSTPTPQTNPQSKPSAPAAPSSKSIKTISAPPRKPRPSYLTSSDPDEMETK